MAHIGYQVVGSGDLDVVLMHQCFTNIEAMWDVPLLASFVEEVSAFARVLLFDKRGTGVSDPGDPERDQYLETFRSDLRSLLDVVGFNRPSGYVNAQTTSKLKNVGCEVCHGYGSRHDMFAHHGGKVAEAVCVTCHTPANDPGWNYAAKLPRVSH